MTVYYRKAAATGNWDEADGFNTQADGLGSNYTAGASEAGNTFDCNGVNFTLNIDVTCTLITSSNAAGYITVSGTRSITGNVTYASTSTSGMVRATTGAGLTVVGLSTNSSSGYCYVLSGTAPLTLSNVGGTAITLSAGRLFHSTGSGAITINGNVAQTSTGYLWAESTAVVTITGNVSAATGFIQARGTTTWTLNGDITSTIVSLNTGVIDTQSGVSFTWNGTSTGASSATIVYNTGTFIWSGARTLAASKTCVLWLVSGTMNLSNLVLTNSGTFIVHVNTGTLTGTNATITNQSAAASAAQIGTTALTIVGPSLPTAGNVVSGTGTFGYAGDLQTPTFDEAARNTDPGEENVLDGTAYLIQNVAKEGTMPLASATNPYLLIP